MIFKFWTSESASFRISKWQKKSTFIWLSCATHVHLTFVFGFPQWPHSNCSMKMSSNNSIWSTYRNAWVLRHWHQNTLSWCRRCLAFVVPIHHEPVVIFLRHFFKQLNFGFWFNHVGIFLQNLKNRAAQTILSTPWKFNIYSSPLFQKERTDHLPLPSIFFRGHQGRTVFSLPGCFSKDSKIWDIWHLDFADFHIIGGLALVIMWSTTTAVIKNLRSNSVGNHNQPSEWQKIPSGKLTWQ